MTGCCCKNCNGLACAYCATTPQLRLFASVTGMTLQPSGVAFTNACTGTSAVITYTGSAVDRSSCILQTFAGGDPCSWGTSAISSPTSVGFTYVAFGTSGAAGVSHLVLQLSGTTWTVQYFQDGSPGDFFMFFVGTLTDASPDCKNPSLTFTNSTVVGNCYTPIAFGGQAVGIATGGSITITFVKSCCP